MERQGLDLTQTLESLVETPEDKPQGFGFKEFTADELDSFFAIASIRRFDPSDILISNQGTTSDLHFILEGQIKIEVSLLGTFEKTLLLGPGTVVGEQSFLDGEPRNATVTAETLCTIASLSRDSFEIFATEHPSTAFRVIRQLTRILSRRLRRLDLFDAIEYTREVERKRLAEELHDETMADLTGLTMELGLLKTHEGLGDLVLDEIDSTREKLKETNLRLRQIVKGIYPAELVNSGLVSALTSYLKDLEDRPIQNPSTLKIGLRSVGFGSQRLPSNLEGDLYRVIQQAITNAVQHANASVIDVNIHWSDDGCRFSVTDDGRGIGSIDRDSIVKSGHFGLANMRDRIERNSGLLEIGDAIGSGTSLVGTIPTAYRQAVPTQDNTYEVTLKNTS
tara:strand:+ start:509 stop:1690 length:1182 start_codon:yes stop_codon:yes gene_type:complete